MNIKAAESVIDQCLQHISEIRKTDPFRGITCIVPSHGYIRTIHRAIHKNGGAIAGLTITTMRGFILETADNELLISGKRYMDSIDINSIYSEILKNKKLKWCAGAKDFKVMPGLISSSMMSLMLNSTNPDLSACFSILGEKGKDLALIHKEYCNIKKKSSLADYSDAVILCREIIEKSESIKNSSFIIFDTYDDNLSYLESECINSLSLKTDVIKLSGGNVISPVIDFFTAPYDTLEITGIAERILSLVKDKDTRFEDISVVCPQDYLSIAASEFDSAGIPYYAPGGIPDSKTGASSLVEALFSFISSDMNFQEIKKFLLLCRHVSWVDEHSTDDTDHIKISTSGLLKTARKYGAAEGYENWIRNLDFAIDQENRKDNPDNRTISHLNVLKTMIADIGEYREWFSIELDTAGHADIAKKLISKFIPSGIEKNRILSITDQIGHPAFPSIMTGEEFTSILLPLISSFRVSSGSAEGSVYLTTSIDDGIFDHIFAAGLTEQRFPRKIRQDPVISDIDILNIAKIPGYHMHTAYMRNIMENRRSQKFIGSAYKSWTGSTPSMDILDGKRLFPTPLLMRIYEKAAGTNYTSEGIKKFLIQRGCRSFILPVKDEMPLNITEYQTAGIISDNSEASHYFASNQEAYSTYLIEKVLWGGEKFNEYTGITGINELESVLKMSATHAGNIIQCPYKFFLTKCMKLKDIEEPVPAEDIDVKKVGDLVHEIFEKFMITVRDTRPERDKYEKLLKETSEKVLGEFLETHESRYSVIWEKRKSEIESCLKNFLDYEITNNNTPIECELIFGMNDKPAVSIELGTFTGEFRGKIDRIDKTEDGYSIIDYKTSKIGSYNKGTLDGGRRIQPFIYAEAYRKLTNDYKTPIKAGYYPVKEPGSPILHDYTDVIKNQMIHIFSYMHDIMENGSFFPTGECNPCEFTSICGNMIGRQIEKKICKKSPILNNYNTIKEYE